MNEKLRKLLDNCFGFILLVSVGVLFFSLNKETSVTGESALDARFLEQGATPEITIRQSELQPEQRVRFKLTAPERLYRSGDRICMKVDVDDTSDGVLRIALGAVFLSKPTVLSLYVRSRDRNWGSTINLRGGSRIKRDETCNIEFQLTPEILQALQQQHHLTLHVEYDYAQNSFSGTFSSKSGTQDIDVELKPLTHTSNAYILRQPNTRRAFAVMERSEWTVVVDYTKMATFRALVWWAPAHGPSGRTIVYAGVKGSRFHYVIDHPHERKTSFEGKGYRGFGFCEPDSVVWDPDSNRWNGNNIPVFWDSLERPAFFARKEGGWCVIIDGVEHPLHKDCLPFVLFVRGGRQCVYFVRDDTGHNDILYNATVGFGNGKESVLFRNIKELVDVDTFEWRKPDAYLKSSKQRHREARAFSSPKGKVAFASRSYIQASRPIYVCFTGGSLPSDAEGSLPQCTICGPWHDVDDFWWSPLDKLVFVGNRKSICIDGKVVTPSKALDIFDAEFKGSEFHEAVTEWVKYWEKR